MQDIHVQGYFTKQRTWKTVNTLHCRLSIETVFRIIISANRLSIFGAVAVCEEFETHQDGAGEPDVLMGQSIVLGEIKAEDSFAE